MTPCETCARLTDKDGQLEQLLMAALDALEASEGKSAEERAVIRQEASEARLDFEIARLELEQHKLEHLRLQHNTARSGSR